MKELVDLYAKLLIGTFSFIGPSFTLLIPIFYTAILNSQIKHASMLRNLQLIAFKEAEGDVLSGLRNGNRALQRLIKRNQKDLDRLDPKRQVKRLFFSLFLSIIFVMFYYFQGSHFWKFDYEWIRVVSILLSLICFLFCLMVLWQIFCIIIQIKKEEKSDQPKSPMIKLKS